MWQFVVGVITGAVVALSRQPCARWRDATRTRCRPRWPVRPLGRPQGGRNEKEMDKVEAERDAVADAMLSIIDDGGTQESDPELQRFIVAAQTATTCAKPCAIMVSVEQQAAILRALDCERKG